MTSRLFAPVSVALMQLRHRLRQRQRSQNLVEFGLSVAAVAFVALIGFNALSTAQARYWGAIVPQLAPAPPPTGPFLRNTSASMTCDHVALLVGKTTTCTVTIADSDPAPKQMPQGTVALSMDNGSSSSTCASLTAITPPSPAVSAKCTLTWTPTSSDVGNRTATVVYTPTDGVHRPPTPATVQSILVQPVLFFGGACRNNYYVGSGVEPGHPLVCSVAVFTDVGLTTLYNKKLDVTWTPQSRLGDVFLYCATGNTCNSATPVEDGTITCQTDPSTGGTCSIIYRRSFDDLIRIASGGEGLTVSALPTDNALDNAAVMSLSIIQAKDSHPVQSAVDCSGAGITSNVSHNINLYPTPIDPTHINKLQLKTAQHLGIQAGTQITCQLVVVDIDPNPALNAYGCPYQTTNPTWCTDDMGDAHPPLGTVTFVDQSGTTAIAGQSGTCSSNGLGHLGARPTGTFAGTSPTSFGVPLPKTNQPEYASWCSVTMILPPGTTKLSATYNGEGTPGPFSPHALIPASAAQTIDVTLHP